MQLFIVTGKKDNSTYIIDDIGLIHQITRVLRMRPGDFFVVQPDGGLIRYTLKILSLTSTCITTIIISETQGTVAQESITIVVAMPNKFEKAELIVQKAAEIGVNEILFWPARRSILKEFPEKKRQRCLLIAKEATEQSRGRQIPTISWSPTIPNKTNYTEQFLVDYHEHSQLPSVFAGNTDRLSGNKRIAYIGPEGGFHEDEYSYFASLPMKQLVLGNQVLRMETAAIATGWRLSTQRIETTSIGVTIVK